MYLIFDNKNHGTPLHIILVCFPSHSLYPGQGWREGTTRCSQTIYMTRTGTDHALFSDVTRIGVIMTITMTSPTIKQQHICLRFFF